MMPAYRRRSPSLFTRFGVLLAGFILMAGCERESASPISTDIPPASMPKQAIDFTLPDLAGRPHALTEYLERGPVMLVFFTTWCPYCRREIPSLKAAYREYGATGLQVVAVNAGLADSLENARAYALEHRLPYPVLYDADGDIAGRYGVRSVPQLFYILQDGRIGGTSRQVSRRAILSLLETTMSTPR